MGCCSRGLCAKWRLLRPQLRGHWRGFRSRPCRPPHPRLPSLPNGHAERTPCSARTGGRRRRRALKVRAMLRLFQAGVSAACMQCLAILLTTLLILSYAHHRIENLQVPADDPAVQSLIPLLQLIYLVTAVGVAATRHRFVDLTAGRIRRASRLMNHSDPDRAANTLMISLWFAAMGFAAVTLSSPPSFLTEQGWHLGLFDAAPIIWSGIMSLGVASFGANAQAAALKQ